MRAEDQRSNQAEGQTARHGQQSIEHHRLNDACLVRPERHADADFLGPLRRGMRDHAEDSDGRQKQSGAREEAHHGGFEVAAARRLPKCDPPSSATSYTAISGSIE